MKNLLIALSTACVLSLSTSAMAGDADVSVINSGITQIQHGFNQEQDAIIGLVSDDYKGNATILVKGSSILQQQGKHDNKQTAKIAVVGCDCVEGKKKH